MRTTIEFDPDTAKEIQRFREEQGRGLSEAVNELIRRGMMQREDTRAFIPRTYPLGLKVDVSNVADAIDFLEGSDAR